MGERNVAEDSLRFLQAILLAESKQPRKKPETPPAPTVTLSRDYGAGGEEVAKRVADYLGVKTFDQEILEAVAKAIGTDPHLLQHLDERVSSMWDSWLRSLVGGRDIYRTNYRRRLFDVVLGIACTGGVILGRGAHLILATRQAFRVRITGSPQRCAQRVAEAEGLTVDEALQRILEVNAERERYIRDTYGRELNNASDFDLIINTDKYADLDLVARLIITAMGYSGIALPPSASDATGG